MLQSYGFKLGLKLLSRGAVREALPFLIIPVNYWRTLEYRVVMKEGAFNAGDKVLDVGSPKLLSLYLADVVKSDVYATDIEDYFVRKFEMLREARGVPPSRYHLQVEDGRKMSFADREFDKIFAISVIEHIPDDGDSLCVAEMNRVLAPGGRCVITVPFSPESMNEYKNANFYWAGSSKKSEDGKVFFQRRYSEADLHERIVKPSGLKPVSIRYVGDRLMTKSKKEFSEYLPKVAGHIHPLMSRMFHTPPADSWRDLDKPLCAIVVLEKERGGGNA